MLCHLMHQIVYNLSISNDFSKYLGKHLIFYLITKNVDLRYLLLVNFKVTKLHAFVIRFSLQIQDQSLRFFLFLFFLSNLNNIMHTKSD